MVDLGKIAPMATRIDDLTEAARPIAAEMMQRTGNLKLALSAGVVALSKLSADDREQAISIANGAKAVAFDLYTAQQKMKRIRSLAEEQRLKAGLKKDTDTEAFCAKVLEFISEATIAYIPADETVLRKKVLQILHESGATYQAKPPK